MFCYAQNTISTLFLTVKILQLSPSNFFSFRRPQILRNPIPEDSYATPDELIRSTKQVTLATAKAVGAGNTCKQEDVVAASNAARQAVFQMLHACRVGNFIIRRLQ